MGKNSRLRRVAKQRKQQRAGTRPSQGERLPPPSDAVDEVAVAVDAIRDARYHRSLGVPASRCALSLIPLSAAIVDRAIGEMLRKLLGGMFAGGWTPVDLFEVVSRRIAAADTSYLLDAAAAATATHPDHLVDPRWQAQLDQVDGRVWWDVARPQLSQWAERDGKTRHEALTMAITLFETCDQLPRIEQMLPPPGSSLATGAVRAVDAGQEKILAKVRALLAKAESTDFDEEAEALSAKAQELMSRYALDRAMLDHRRGIRQQATLSRIWLDNPYISAKALLVDAVSSANRCSTVLSSRFGFATVIGDEGDLRVVELLATSLLVQGTRAMLSAGTQLTTRGVSRTRSFRQAFLIAYATRIGERLREANEASAATVDAGSLLPVLASRSRAVDEMMQQTFPRLVHKQVSVSNVEGWGAGTAAADLARLDVHDAVTT